ALGIRATPLEAFQELPEHDDTLLALCRYTPQPLAVEEVAQHAVPIVVDLDPGLAQLLARQAHERVAIQSVHPLLAFAHLAQEPGALELFDVVGHDRLGDAQCVRELPPGVRTLGDESQYA